MIITDGRFWEIYYGGMFVFIFLPFAVFFFWIGGPYWAANLLTILTAASIYRCGKKQSILLEPDKNTITVIDERYAWRDEETFSINDLRGVTIKGRDFDGDGYFDIKLVGLVKPLHLKKERNYSDACAIQEKVAAYLGLPAIKRGRRD